MKKFGVQSKKMNNLTSQTVLSARRQAFDQFFKSTSCPTKTSKLFRQKVALGVNERTNTKAIPFLNGLKTSTYFSRAQTGTFAHDVLQMQTKYLKLNSNGVPDERLCKHLFCDLKKRENGYIEPSLIGIVEFRQFFSLHFNYLDLK